MMKRCLLIMAIGIMITGTVFGNEIEPLKRSDFAVKIKNISISLMQDICEVIEQVGKPNTREIINDSGPDKIHYKYDGLIVGISTYDMKVHSLQINDNNVSTIREITIGDSVEKVREKYGIPAYKSSEIVQYEWKLPNNILGKVFLITFEIQENEVMEITINPSSGA